MFKKIPKEEWLKLSKEEQDYFTFEFNKSVEKRKRITIITTRTLALLCIFMLFWIGFVQFKAIENYNEIIDIYGNNGYCYLCGEKTLKACECQYFTNEFVLENQYIFDNYSKVVADYNGKKCSGMKVNENERYNQFLIPYDLSFDSFD